MTPQITVTEIPMPAHGATDALYGVLILLIFVGLTFFGCRSLYKQARAMEAVEKKTSL